MTMDIREHDIYNLSSRSCDHTDLVKELRELRKMLTHQHERIDRLVKRVYKLEKRES